MTALEGTALEGTALEGTALDGPVIDISTTAASLPVESPFRAAATATVHAFLNCYLRETDGWRIVSNAVRVPLSTRRSELVVDLEYRSPTLRHRFRLPARLETNGMPTGPVSAATAVAMLIDELAVTARADESGGVDLLARVVDSMSAIGHSLDTRRGEVERLWAAGPLTFEESEQALLIGHMVHPTPKSRADMTEAERDRYSPETAGRFPLHWLAVDPEWVHHDSATGTSAIEMARRLVESDPRIDPAALDRRLAETGLGGRVLMPAHPWEAAYLALDGATADLFDSGVVVDLGPLGSDVVPTTSVRTVIAGTWQLKFSLHVRVTNSMRVTLPKELGRAVEAARLAQSALAPLVADAAPAFTLIQDPAFLTVRRPDGTVESGFSVLFRERSWDSGSSDITALTTLCQDHPFVARRSRLGNIVESIATRDNRAVHDVGREWFGRFSDIVVRSLVRLYGDVGLCFKAHQQNMLVELVDGWPVRGLYRDSQGYFHRELAHADMVELIPGLGEVTESIFPEDLADERLVYYLFLNMTLGVVNALGVAGVADERVLLADLRRLLTDERDRGGRYPLTLVDRLLDDERWPCKGNLRTRFGGLDELVGDIATQSVYVTIPNPLWSAG